jgi:outer membrane protein OmpA-like peptidoglycan-associated protein/Tol biopolymer transport system component
MKTHLLSLFTLFLTVTAFAQKKERLPSQINSPNYIEYAPSVSADGQTMIFQSDQYGLFVNASKKVPSINAEGRSDVVLDEFEASFFGIYEVKLHPSGQWLQPKDIKSINLYASEMMTPVMGGPSISYDGNQLFFFANFQKDGMGREDIYFSQREKNDWSKPINIGKAINTSGHEGFPSISPDGRRLYFTREVPGKFEDKKQCYKIMVSEKNRRDEWRFPFELPAPVNGFCEKAPRIMADGKTLVFSSIRDKGRGDFDLYKSVLQPDGSWTEPENLSFVNSKKSDVFVSMNPCGDLMYFVSDGDIYSTEIPLALRPTKIATVQGYVVDLANLAPIPAKIIVKDVTSGETISVLDNNPADGRYTALLPFGTDYEISVNLPEFYTKKVLVKESTFIDCKVVSVNIPLSAVPMQPVASNSVSQPVRVVENAVEKPINSPTPSAIEELELVAETPESDKVKIEAQGVKKVEEKNITQYALILRVADKETDDIIPNADLKVTYTDGSAFERPVQRNGNELIVKALLGETLAISVEATGYMAFEAKLPPFTQDRRVIAKLAPVLLSYLTINVISAATNRSVEAVCEIKYENAAKEEKLTAKNGTLKVQLKTSDKLIITARAEGFEPLSKSVDVDIPKDGSRSYDVELKMVTISEFFLNLEALNIETGQVIPNAVFYVFDADDKRISELIADSKGKARVKIPKGGKYKVQLLAEGFNTGTQVIENALNENNVQFKIVPKKNSLYELKVYTFDAFTGEEVNLSVKNADNSTQKTPFFIKGEANQSFAFVTSGSGYAAKQHDVKLVDSLMNRVRVNLTVSKDYYDIDLRIFDKATQQPVYRPDLKFIEIETKSNKATATNDGFYTVAVSPNRNYSLQINQAGYETVGTKINGADWVKAGIEQDFFLQKIKAAAVAENTTNESSTSGSKEVIETKEFGKIEKGKAIVMKEIYFDQSSPVLRETSFAQLEKLATVLKENPLLKAEIKGHTDNEGDFFLNVTLSKDRCQAVVNYLVTQGIETSRLKINGRGSLEPIALNDNEDNRSQNRRVEFILN